MSPRSLASSPGQPASHQSPPPRQRSPPSPPPPAAKKQKQPPKKQSSAKEPSKKKEQTKKKAKEPAKLPWEKTYEECCEKAKKAVDEYFKPKKLEKKVPINLANSTFFLKMNDANRRKFIPPSDYDHPITNSYEKKKKKPAGSSDVPQLRAQKKQSIEQLVVLPAEQQGLIAFLGTSSLSAA
ncbi:hypothetical protein C2845_PM12G14760 [Panicum miliaceum]|uniref:Uncharacterized protein n=1 Tax=Panicum miliaceum TaxID=4540 RepID=A0A3L6QFL5_PANMI|nr:hypothetical protein C2845_PM12G14760 [Panicum miliaceum]